MYIVLIIIICIAIVAIWHYRHQRSLRVRAYLLCEAIRNKDYSFRLSRKSLFFGERAMQEAFYEISREISRQQAEKEVESWQRLTRVLTHEIMNTTAPIASISQAFLKREDVKGTPLEEGIRAICDTSRGLNDFVQNYRKLAQLQKPTPKDVALKEFVESVAMSYPEIFWKINISETMIVHTDETLLRQVFINLVKNAIEAGAKSVGVKESQNKILLISNDGAPIPAEIRKDIFTPFFSTKRTGSGIGLSLSRQIMVMQGGELALQYFSESTYHTTFSLRF